MSKLTKEQENLIEQYTWVQQKTLELYTSGLITETVLDEVFDAINKKLIELGLMQTKSGKQ